MLQDSTKKKKRNYSNYIKQLIYSEKIHKKCVKPYTVCWSYLLNINGIFSVFLEHHNKLDSRFLNTWEIRWGKSDRFNKMHFRHV